MRLDSRANSALETNLLTIVNCLHVRALAAKWPSTRSDQAKKEHEVTSKSAIEVSIHASCFFKAESRISSAASAEFSNAKVHNVVARSTALR